MGTKTIGQLTSATSIASADLLEIEQGGVSKSIASSFVAMPVGAMSPFAGASAPSGWFICDGMATSRSTYVALFTIIGTTWGSGDGSTTFNIPDMREKVPVGIGTSGTLITSTGSAVSANDVYTLAQFKDDQMQGHFHTQKTLQKENVGMASTGSSYYWDAQAGTNVSNAVQSNITTIAPITDGTNGTPRTGSATRGKRVGVNYIIKY